MKVLRILARIAGVFLAMALLVGAGAMVWAAIDDFQTRDTVPEGVTVAGHALGGMDSAQARTAIEAAVSAPLMDPISVESSGPALSFDPKTAISLDVEKMLSEAYSSRREATFIDRLRETFLGASLPATVSAEYAVNEAAVKSWVATVASQVNTLPANAEWAVAGSELAVRPASPGVTVDQTATTAAIVQALNAGKAAGEARKITLSIKLTLPTVTEQSFGKVIVVSLSQRRVRLYEAGALIKTYPCAVGTSEYPTPTGDWKVIGKTKNPSWGNPGSDWAKSMPAYIPPGPDNPLGTRAIELSASYILFHGTSDINSVGTPASHGCMRMYQQDIEEMYELVPVGTPVYIRQ